MHLLAIRRTAELALTAARRFPTVVLAAATATAAALILIGPGGHRTAENILLAAVVGFPLLIGLSLVGERLAPTGWRRRLPPVLGVGLMAVFYLLTADAPAEQRAARFMSWSLAFHLLAAVGPYLFAGTSRGFWQYNRLLLQRLLLAGIYSAVLFVGLALALGAIDRLLGVRIDDHTYPRLFAVLALGFSTWFFVAGVPHELRRLDHREDFPAGLRVFAQYLLVPLVTVYLIIVLLYLGRVVVTRTWPSGWIGYLVSGLAVTGNLALLLIHPVRERATERWVNQYARWYYVTMVPALVMALLAVGQRIRQYGVTEPRYALAVLAGWLLVVSAYHAVTRSRSIKILPVSLLVVAALAMVGPWGLLATSRRSQEARFRDLVVRNDMLDPTGRVRLAGTEPSQLDLREMRAVLRYLDQRHGPARIAIAIGVPRDSVAGWASAGDAVARGLARIGVPEFEFVADPVETIRRFQRVDSEGTVSPGVDLGGGLRWYAERMLLVPFQLTFGPDTLSFRPALATGAVSVWRSDSLLATILLGEAMAPFLDGPGAPRPAVEGRLEPLVVESQGGGYRFRFLVNEMTWPLRMEDSVLRTARGSLTVDRP